MLSLAQVFNKLNVAVHVLDKSVCEVTFQLLTPASLHVLWVLTNLLFPSFLVNLFFSFPLTWKETELVQLWPFVFVVGVSDRLLKVSSQRSSSWLWRPQHFCKCLVFWETERRVSMRCKSQSSKWTEYAWKENIQLKPEFYIHQIKRHILVYLNQIKIMC